MDISRQWAMPSPNTFTIPPIKALVERWITVLGGESLDPFARDSPYATYRNDINPASPTQYHLDAYEFLLQMEIMGVRPNVVLFDPPYSPRQAVDCYAAAGVDPREIDAARKRKGNAWQRTKNWSEEKEVIARIQPLGGHVLSFGWDSNGVGKKRGYEIVEVMLVCHGACHNDTICTVERKVK